MEYGELHLLLVGFIQVAQLLVGCPPASIGIPM